MGQIFIMGICYNISMHKLRLGIRTSNRDWIPPAGIIDKIEKSRRPKNPRIEDRPGQGFPSHGPMIDRMPNRTPKNEPPKKDRPSVWN